jgi:hypothetical protein
MSTDEERTITDDANDAYDIVKNMCHSLPVNAPAPLVYSVLGNLKLASGYMMRDLLAGMVSGMSRSLIDFDNYVWGDDDASPAEAIAKANAHLETAIRLAAQLGDELSSAQAEISMVGYRTPGDVGYRKPEERHG